MSKEGFIIEKRFNAPRVPWEAESVVLDTLPEATSAAATWKRNNSRFRYRVLYRSKHGSEVVVVPPEAFDFNHELNSNLKGALNA
jgi:hypothetical protein